MITKKEFVDIIERLKETNDTVEKVNEILRNTRNSIENDFMNASAMSISHESVVVKLLENMFNDKDEWISWWLYEQDYGRTISIDDAQDEKGNNIDITTPEKFYDFLIKNMEENKC